MKLLFTDLDGTLLTDDKQILDAMYSFFFADEDWGNGNKIWHYMKCKYDK